MKTLEHWTGPWAPLIRLVFGLATLGAGVRLVWWLLWL